jgi:tellurite resistance protein
MSGHLDDAIAAIRAAEHRLDGELLAATMDAVAAAAALLATVSSQPGARLRERMVYLQNIQSHLQQAYDGMVLVCDQLRMDAADMTSEGH